MPALQRVTRSPRGDLPKAQRQRVALAGFHGAVSPTELWCGVGWEWLGREWALGHWRAISWPCHPGPVSLQFLYSEGGAALCLLSQPVRGGEVRVLTAQKGKFEEMKTKPFFFLKSLFVASRNNPEFCRARFRIMADRPPPPPPQPSLPAKPGWGPGVVGKLTEKSGRLVAGESVPGGCCLLTHRLVPENRPPSAQQTSWRPLSCA